MEEFIRSLSEIKLSANLKELIDNDFITSADDIRVFNLTNFPEKKFSISTEILENKENGNIKFEQKTIKSDRIQNQECQMDILEIDTERRNQTNWESKSLEELHSIMNIKRWEPNTSLRLESKNEKDLEIETNRLEFKEKILSSVDSDIDSVINQQNNNFIEKKEEESGNYLMNLPLIESFIQEVKVDQETFESKFDSNDEKLIDGKMLSTSLIIDIPSDEKKENELQTFRKCKSVLEVKVDNQLSNKLVFSPQFKTLFDNFELLKERSKGDINVKEKDEILGYDDSQNLPRENSKVISTFLNNFEEKKDSIDGKSKIHIEKFDRLLRRNSLIQERTKSYDTHNRRGSVANNNAETQQSKFQEKCESLASESFCDSPKSKSSIDSSHEFDNESPSKITARAFFQKANKFNDHSSFEEHIKELIKGSLEGDELGISTNFSDIQKSMNTNEYSNIMDTSNFMDESINLNESNENIMDGSQLGSKLFSRSLTRYIAAGNDTNEGKPLEVIKEGGLLKKSKNMIGNFLSRWFVLTDNKLMYFKNKSRGRVKGCINFAMVKAEIKRTKKNEFQVQIVGYKKMVLKGKNETDVDEWFNCISKIIENNQNIDKPEIDVKDAKLYMNIDIIAESEFLSICQTGDILLFKTNTSTAKLQRSLTGSKYDHVGLIIAFDKEVNVFDTQLDTGVALNPWKSFIEENDLFEKLNYDFISELFIDEFMFPKINRRHFKPKYSILLLYKFQTYSQDTVGLKYELNAKKIFRRKSVQKRLAGDVSPKIKNGYFCSELVASAYKFSMIIDQRQSSSSYWPGSFSSEKDLKLLQSCKLAPETAILLERHVK